MRERCRCSKKNDSSCRFAAPQEIVRSPEQERACDELELLYPTGACSDPGNFLAPILAMAWLGRSDQPQQEHQIFADPGNNFGKSHNCRRRQLEFFCDWLPGC